MTTRGPSEAAILGERYAAAIAREQKLRNALDAVKIIVDEMQYRGRAMDWSEDAWADWMDRLDAIVKLEGRS
jgi:hypothetical protein